MRSFGHEFISPYGAERSRAVDAADRAGISDHITFERGMCMKQCASPRAAVLLTAVVFFLADCGSDDGNGGSQPVTLKVMTYNNLADRIDHIFLAGDGVTWSATDWLADLTVYGPNQRYPSDHFPVVAQVAFE
jgi:hypothetical protein